MALINEDRGRFKTLTRRAVLLGGAQALLFGGLAARMYYLQVIEGDRYVTLAEENRINLRLLPPPRGHVVDRFGVPLALNQQNYRVVLVREQARDIARVLNDLARIVPISLGDRERIERELAKKRGFVPVTVRENLSWEQVSQIEVNAPDLPGVSIEVGQTRLYPHSESHAHVLGYVGAVSEKELTGDPLLELPGFRIGKTGIERQYDTQLRGKAGTSQIEVNALGRVIRELKREEGTPGREAVLTLDSGLQNYAHQRLMGEQSATAVVMDVLSGEILALASNPGYDPNAFALGLSSTEWQALVNDPLTPLSNKAISGLYAPGSTFKMIVALAALENGIGAGHRAFCPGFMTLGNARFHCWKNHGHGWVDMHEGIKQSCDVYFYDLARKIGIDQIAAMAMRLGLGGETGIDLPGERAGVVPTREWKLGAIGEPWQGGETLVTAIGQGFVLATPLQLAVMTARIANGGKPVRPRLLRGFRGEETPTDGTDLAVDAGISAAHMAVIHKAMDAVTNSERGTAYRARIDEAGFEMAGKTGTSQVRRISKAEREAGVVKNEDLPWRRRDHALFVAFAPVERPRYCCAVVVEHGGGGSKAAAPIARDILLETQLRDPSSRAAPLLAEGARGES